MRLAILIMVILSADFFGCWICDKVVGNVKIKEDVPVILFFNGIDKSQTREVKKVKGNLSVYEVKKVKSTTWYRIDLENEYWIASNSEIDYTTQPKIIHDIDTRYPIPPFKVLQ